jgi:hypothetical protein
LYLTRILFLFYFLFLFLFFFFFLARPASPSYRPHVNLSVPDFDRLHSEFAADLDRVKRSKELTKVIEFDITQTKPKKVHREEHKLFKAKPYFPPPPPDEIPQSTKKLDQIKEKNTRMIAEREEKERMKLEEREKKLKQSPDMQQKLIPKIVSLHSHGHSTTDETIKELTRKAKKEIKEADAQWAARVNEMKQRVRQRPLLVESYNSVNGRIEARKKALIAIKESLDKAGIKDQAKFFDQQELNDLDLKF